MTGKTHVAFGAGIAMLGSVYYASNGYDMASNSLLFAGCILGSLFPDIDSPKSILSQHIPLLPKIINKVFGHRNFIHSPFFLALLSYGIIYFYPDAKHFIYGFILGFCSHLLLDMCNRAGIPIFYPISKYRFHFLDTKSGAKYEFITASILYFIIFCLFILFLSGKLLIL